MKPPHRVTKKDLVPMYAELIRLNFQGWLTLNRIIIEHWSHSGLQDVKEAAWKLLAQQESSPADSVQEES